ncbi:hypothetical protein ACIQI8_00485 [Streptomyces sp. NPDC092369]|uniref:hypothetical protein n=1 Tax=Streptomyces sp. NPDC092369 TaxID=3366015 RepID=UPI003818171E
MDYGMLETEIRGMDDSPDKDSRTRQRQGRLRRGHRRGLPQHRLVYRVTYVDELISPHVSEGEIHCATNTVGDVCGADARWWRD